MQLSLAMFFGVAKARPVTKRALLRGHRTLKQSVMPPHDILASLYENALGTFHQLLTGLPGEIDVYWSQNEDLAADVQWPGVDAWPVQCLQL